jgi:hypothetical protein
MGESIPPVLALLVVLILIVLALRMWWGRCSPALPDSGVTRRAHEIGMNIEMLQQCPADEAFRTVVVTPLEGLWAQYKALSIEYPEAAAYHLYNALSALESDLVPLSSALVGECADWKEKARCALRELPRNVRLLGVALHVE